MERLGIVLWSSDYLPNIGGVAAAVHNLGRGLVAAGHNVVVLTTTPQRTACGWLRESIDGLEVHRMGPTLLPRDRGGWRLRLRHAEMVYRRLQQECAGVIFHWHNHDDAYAPNDPSIARVFTVHVSDILRDVHIPDRAARWARMLQRPDHVIGVCSERQQVAWTLGVPPGRTSLIPNGVDTSVFRPDAELRARTRSALQIRANDCVLLCPRRATPVSGMLDFAHALRWVGEYASSCTVLFAGGSPECWDPYEAAVMYALQSGPFRDSFRWLGRVPNREMPALYAAADLAVVPSLQEGCSIAILEAFASGVPVLASDVGGNPELVTDGVVGMLVPSGAPRDLAERLRRCLADQSTLAPMGHAALCRARTMYDWSVVVERTRGAYAAALEHALRRNGRIVPE